jgi:hypothetical protein
MFPTLSERDQADLASCLAVCIDDTATFQTWEFQTVFGFERADLERSREAWLAGAAIDAATCRMFTAAVGQVLGYPGAITRVPPDVGERLPALFARLWIHAGEGDR